MQVLLLTFIGSSYNITSSKNTIIHDIFIIKNYNMQAFEECDQMFVSKFY